MSNILTVRNYIKQHIYKVIIIRYPKLSKTEILLKLQSIFKELINNIRYISITNEIDTINTPMGFLFQHIKKDIINIVANCSPLNDKLFLDKDLIYNFEWNIRLFNCLKILNAKDILIWYFLQIPYFNILPNNVLPNNVLPNNVPLLPNNILPQATDSNGNNNNITIIKYRLLYEQLLDYFLINWTSEIYLTENEFIYISNETCMPYAISYHNQNNVAILIKYCKLLRKICPWLNYYSPKLAEKVLKQNYINQNHSSIPENFNNANAIVNANIRGLKEKVRICFISDCFNNDTSVLRDRISIIGKLDRSKYDVYIASFNPIESTRGSIAPVFMKKFKDNYIYLGGLDITNARLILDKYEFDFIVYPDLGMKLLPTLLAYSRIALKQITTWGHSETSGIDTIDYYISSSLFEHPEAQNHYSENLILFKSLGTFYISPHKLFIQNANANANARGLKENANDKENDKENDNKVFKTKLELGFRDEDNIYCCLQTFYKINVEFERCMSRILDLDPNGIILLSNSFPYCKSHLARIKYIFGETKLQRLRWYPSLVKKDFLNLVNISYVCLDPFPFGGCNTSYDAFDYNIPVITLPSTYLHGRFTLGLYKKMGLEDCECIVKNIDEYSQIASQIAINARLRHKINRNIEMWKYLIFQEQASIDEWNAIFMQL